MISTRIRTVTRRRRPRRGASLVENGILLGLVSVIALGAIDTYGFRVRAIFSNATHSLRDMQRVSDIQTIASALEAYRERFGQYPHGSGSNPAGAASDRACWINNQTNDLNNCPLGALISAGMLPSLPVDPGINGATGYVANGCGRAQVYAYYSTGAGFLLAAQMETQGNTGCTQLGSWRAADDNGYTFQYHIRRGL